MPGFGTGPFGKGTFGGSRWTRLIFWEHLPDLYRRLDTEGWLYRFLQGVGVSFDLLREKIRLLHELRDPLLVRSHQDEVTLLHLGKSVAVLGELVQLGVDGRIDTLRRFVAPTARFRDVDVGKDLVLHKSSISANNTIVRIIGVLHPTVAILETLLTEDLGPLHWELRDVPPSLGNELTVQVYSGYVDRVSPGWILYDGRTEYRVLRRRQFPTDRTAKQPYAEQEGSDGSLLTNRIFSAPSAQFHFRDVGKKLAVAGSQEKRVYEVVEVVSPTEVRLDQDYLLDGGPVYWALRFLPELDLEATSPFRGVVEQAGEDLELIPPFTVQTSTGRFGSRDVGKRLLVRGSALGRDGRYQISTVVSPFVVEVVAGWSGVSENGLLWEVRAVTGIGDGTQVRVSAPSLLHWLAQDFGITVDIREPVGVQRKWVKNVAGWIPLKGSRDGYTYVGKLSGFTIEVSSLFRVSYQIYSVLKALGVGVIEVGEAVVGRYGVEGALKDAGGAVFTSSIAKFVPADAGLHLILSSTAVPTNTQICTISSVVDAHTVRLSAWDVVTVPDHGVGGTDLDPRIRWSVARLYSAKPPLLPRYDDFVHSLMKEVIAWKAIGTTFDIDKFCWEDDFDAEVPVDFVSAAGIGVGTWDVVVQTPVGQPASAEVITGVGAWQFVDTEGRAHYLETVPIALGGNQFQFQVNSIFPPVAWGPVVPMFRYVCSHALSCQFCPSNKVWIQIGIGPELLDATGVELENLFLRVVDRLEQAKPIHVEFVVVFQRDVAARLHFGANIDTHPDIGAILSAYIRPRFDDIAGDVLEADRGLTADVESIIT